MRRTRLRVIDTGREPSRRAIATSAALLERVGRGEADPVLRFSRYEPCCVIGRFQDVATELDIRACHESGTTIARRVTGGGAVVMGDGSFALDLVVPGAPAMMARTARLVGESIIEALAAFGLSGEASPAGSILLNGWKISGAAGRAAQNALMHQSSFVVDVEELPLLDLLKRRTEGGRPTGDARHRVIGLRQAREQQAGPLRYPPQDDAALRDLLTRQIATRLSAAPEPDTLSQAEIERAEDLLTAWIGRDGFVMTGRSDREEAA